MRAESLEKVKTIIPLRICTFPVLRSVHLLLVLCCVVARAQEVAIAPDARVSLIEMARAALSKHPTILIAQQQVGASKALERQASGQFDTVTSAGTSLQYLTTPLTVFERQSLLANSNLLAATTFATSIGASRQFRNGISIQPSLGLTRVVDNDTQNTGVNSSQAAFQVIVPLLRGRGAAEVDAQESAARIEANATELDLDQTIAQILTTVATSYWNFVAAKEGLRVTEGSEERGRTLVANTHALIDADQLPRAEINNAIANLADRRASRIAAEAQFTDARLELAIAAGLDANGLPPGVQPMDGFPDIETLPLSAIEPETISDWIDQAAHRRADLLAARKREQEQSRLELGAGEQLRPQLDFSLSVGYSGLREGRQPEQWVSALTAGVLGPNAIAGLSYRFPRANNAAIGQYQNSQALVRQAQLRSADLRRQIESAILASCSDLRQASLRVKASNEAVESFQGGLENEREKLRLSAGSVTEVLQVEDRLTTAELNRVQAQLAYALSLTQFRFATGTLVEPGKSVHQIDRSIFFGLPQPPATERREP
jgi:outer membrane protein